MKATVIQLSVCPCGFPSCVDSVTIGTEYEAMGCGAEQMLTGLYVKRCGDSRRPGYLPKALFEIHDPTVKTLSA